ncbi:MAG: hypothetical protein ACRDHG_13650 [Anaerolineales bacterium]
MALPEEQIVGETPAAGSIQGIEAGSGNELNVAWALDRLGHSYIYQYRVFDIGGVVGDFRLDYLVLTTVPFSTPLEVFGEFWHRAQLEAEDEFRLQMIEDHFRGQANDTVIIWGNESETREQAFQAVLARIGPS